VWRLVPGGITVGDDKNSQHQHQHRYQSGLRRGIVPIDTFWKSLGIELTDDGNGNVDAEPVPDEIDRVMEEMWASHRALSIGLEAIAVVAVGVVGIGVVVGAVWLAEILRVWVGGL
jgi:hypothetical protein